MHAFRNALLLAASSAFLGHLAHAANITAAAPDVVYTATGTLASTVLSGTDPLLLAGQNFTINVTANEALKPIRHTATSAEYINLQMMGTGYSGLIPGTSISLSCPTTKIELVAGANGTHDEFLITYQLYIAGSSIPTTISAKLSMPAGTIPTPRIQPFSSPVTFTPTDVKVSYSDAGGMATVLGIASGTLSATLQ